MTFTHFDLSARFANSQLEFSLAAVNDWRADVPEALRGPAPRSTDGSAEYLSKAKLMYRMGMAAAGLFTLPFMVWLINDEPYLPKLAVSLVAIALTWVLPPVLILRYRMRYIERLWREGEVVMGRVEVVHDGLMAFISFSTGGTQQRLGQFWVEPGLEPGMSVPVLALDAIEARAGLCTRKCLNVGRVSPRP